MRQTTLRTTMDCKEEVLKRRSVVPSVSTRTLHHPSFQPLYTAAALARHHRGCNYQTDDPIISPAEIFYSDPTMSCRIPNLVTDLGVFDSLQLSTPPPVMSAYLAPSNQLDPFRSGLHPTRDLGSSEWVENPVSTLLQPSCYIVQLTQKEDQAITNLLKLHHKDLEESDETQAGVGESSVNLNASFSHNYNHNVNSTTAEEVYKPSFTDEEHPKDVGLQNMLQQGRGWSEAEFEAADTLLSCCCVEEEDQETTVMLPVPPSYFTQNDSDCVGFTCVNEIREPNYWNFRSVEDPNVSEVKQMLSDSEGDALCMLLSLGDVATFTTLQ